MVREINLEFSWCAVVSGWISLKAEGRIVWGYEGVITGFDRLLCLGPVHCPGHVWTIRPPPCGVKRWGGIDALVPSRGGTPCHSALSPQPGRARIYRGTYIF